MPQFFGKVAPSPDVPQACLFFDRRTGAGLPARDVKSHALTTCCGDSIREAKIILLLHIQITIVTEELWLTKHYHLHIVNEFVPFVKKIFQSKVQNEMFTIDYISTYNFVSRVNNFLSH